MRQSRIASLFGLTVMLVLTACGGSATTDAADPSSVSTATPTAAPDAYTVALTELTLQDLPALVLQQDDYGLLSLGMEISDESGPQANQDVADDFETIEVPVRQLEALGRLGGYALSFENFTFEEGQIIQIDSWVDLFEDTDGIDEFLELWLEDVRSTDGVGGFELIEITEVDVPTIAGARGWAVQMMVNGFERPISWTVGFVRHGRLVGGVAVYEFGERDRTPEMIGALQQLDQRLRGALDGSLEVTVEHVLPATDDDREVPAPVGGPDLAAMALTVEDLGAGWRLDEDGYYADPTRLALFTRTFKYTEQGAAIVGGSEINGLDAELQLWPSAEQAASFISSRRTLFEGPEGAAHYATVVAEDDGPIVTNVSTHFVDLALGDQGMVMTVAADWNTLGRQTYVYVAIRSGDLVSWTTIDTGGTLSDADLMTIAERAAARLLAHVGE